MAVTLTLKRSAESSKVPLLSDLSPGEIAINTTDGRIYHRHSSDTVAEINAADARTVGGLDPSQLIRSDSDGTLTGNLAVTGGVTAASFSGDGSALGSLDASNLATGTVPFGRLPTGTAAFTVATGNHNHNTLYIALTGNQTVTGLKTFSNGISDGSATLSGGQLNRPNGNLELQYNRSAASEGVVIFGNTARVCRFVASTGNLGLGTATPTQRLDVIGSIRASQPVIFPGYTLATLPTGASYTGAMAYVSDEADGPTMAFYDGTNWRRVQDRAVVSPIP
jgi:hypothetical protein